MNFACPASDSRPCAADDRPFARRFFRRSETYVNRIGRESRMRPERCTPTTAARTDPGNGAR